MSQSCNSVTNPLVSHISCRLVVTNPLVSHISCRLVVRFLMNRNYIEVALFIVSSLHVEGWYWCVGFRKQCLFHVLHVIIVVSDATGRKDLISKPVA